MSTLIPEISKASFDDAGGLRLPERQAKEVNESFKQYTAVFGGITVRLKSLSYAEWEETPQEWCLEKLTFGPRMLIVGKNTAGKSRAIRVTASLARSLIGAQAPTVSGTYKAVFDFNGKDYEYELTCKNAEVIHEKISASGKILLNRELGGVGRIWAAKIGDGQHIDFQVPPSTLAAVARRDQIQHGFIEPLFEWANSLRFYQFNGQHQNMLNMLSSMEQQVDERNENAVVAIFKEGVARFGSAFTESLIADLASIDYQIEKIELSEPITIRFASGGPPVIGLKVKERALKGVTDQFGMSTGMYRVVALLIHVTFAQFKGAASSVLIDDIGEGLDFDRSLRLIELLRAKAEKYNFQLVMTTNDKFVMNHVPLEEWTVLHRTGHIVHVSNHENSKTAFDEFKFTGLSNFSFFEINADQMNFEGIGEGENA